MGVFEFLCMALFVTLCGVVGESEIYRRWKEVKGFCFGYRVGGMRGRKTHFSSSERSFSSQVPHSLILFLWFLLASKPRFKRLLVRGCDEVEEGDECHPEVLRRLALDTTYPKLGLAHSEGTGHPEVLGRLALGTTYPKLGLAHSEPYPRSHRDSHRHLTSPITSRPHFRFSSWSFTPIGTTWLNVTHSHHDNHLFCDDNQLLCGGHRLWPLTSPITSPPQFRCLSRPLTPIGTTRLNVTHSHRDNDVLWPFTSPLTSPPSDVSPSPTLSLNGELGVEGLEDQRSEAASCPGGSESTFVDLVDEERLRNKSWIVAADKILQLEQQVRQSREETRQSREEAHQSREQNELLQRRFQSLFNVVLPLLPSDTQQLLQHQADLQPHNEDDQQTPPATGHYGDDY
ncbi:hypothetical protein Fmac_002521 [Flemingia macrophylla]|uniref:Uncharacterized protein n=1 Tax=Flemingia macrophylla TaxID=520843 RepID=A0ABD1NK59_9FABA